MSDLWENARYVEKNPMDFHQRWRLAKKLYSAWEYRLALENLLILKQEWQQNLNVLRYLAATYYRLGRYEDAISELRQALQIWPNEVGLYEQLARVLEVSGRRTEAAQVWDDVQKIVPNHPFARLAKKRLLEEPRGNSSEDLHLADSDSGIDIRPGRVCTHCGAQNGEEEERCWQCRAMLPQHIALKVGNGETPQEEATAYPLREDLNLIYGLVIVALISTGIYLSLILLLNMGNISQGETFQNLWELYRSNLAISRVVMGLVIVLLWPLTLLLIVRLIQPPDCALSTERILFTGLLTALTAFLCTWLPGSAILLSMAAPATLSLLFITLLYGLGLPRALGVWLLHTALAGVIAVSAFFLSESVQLGRFFNPFREMSAVIQYLQEVETPRANSHDLEDDILPVRQKLYWESTGSAWLDTRVNLVKFNLSTNIISRDLKFELRDSSGTQVFEFIRGLQWSDLVTVTPGETYTIIAGGTRGNQVNIVVTSILEPVFLAEDLVEESVERTGDTGEAAMDPDAPLFRAVH